MNKDNARDYLPLVQALAEGKTIQFFSCEWADCAKNVDFTYPPTSYRIKPKEFKNFQLPWEYIGKEWNFATWNPISKTMILYQEQPKYVEGQGWYGDNATLACGIVPIEVGITEDNGLAQRNEGDA